MRGNGSDGGGGGGVKDQQRLKLTAVAGGRDPLMLGSSGFAEGLKNTLAAAAAGAVAGAGINAGL
jgi:hypothetical protein